MCKNYPEKCQVVNSKYSPGFEWPIRACKKTLSTGLVYTLQITTLNVYCYYSGPITGWGRGKGERADHITVICLTIGCPRLKVCNKSPCRSPSS